MAADMAMPNAPCTQFEALLEDYLESNLNSADAKRAEEHMKDCAACRQAFERGLESVRVFRSAEAAQALPDSSFARLVMARVRTAESQMTAERAGFSTIDLN